MYCSNCGSQIMGQGKFCANCGAAVAGTAPAPGANTAAAPQPQPVVQQPQPVFQTAQNPAQLQPMERFRMNFRGAWKSVAFLLFAICFSLCQFMNYASIEDFLSPIYQVLDYASIVSEDAQGVTSQLELMEFLVVLPGALMAIGCWLIYAESTRKKEEPVRTVGFSLIQGVVIGLLCALVVFVIYILGKVASMKEDYGLYMPNEVENLLDQVQVIILVLSPIIAIFLAILMTTVAKIKHSGQGFDAEGLGWAGTTGAFSLVGALITLVILLNTEFTFAGLLNCITLILLASSLFVYVGAMNKDHHMQYTVEVKQPKPEPQYAAAMGQGGGYVPAWKRVQEEQEAGKAEPKPEPQQQSKLEV